MTIQIGRVEAIFRYPVKSMAGERLEAAQLGWHGIEGDRRLAVVRTQDRSGFPWLTASRLFPCPLLVRWSITAALTLVMSIMLPADMRAQDDPPQLWIQPHLGVTEAHRSLDVLSLGLHVNFSPAVALVGAVDRWSFDTLCPHEFPSTCGDDGWAFSVGLRAAAFHDALVAPFVEPQIGLYRFSDSAREGHTTSSVGARLGVTFSPGNVFRWELAAAMRQMNGYDRDALRYPALRFTSVQLGMGLPIG